MLDIVFLNLTHFPFTGLPSYFFRLPNIHIYILAYFLLLFLKLILKNLKTSIGKLFSKIEDNKKSNYNAFNQTELL